MVLIQMTTSLFLLGAMAQNNSNRPLDQNAMIGKMPIVITKPTNESATSSPPKVSLEEVTVPLGSVQDLLVSMGIEPNDDAYLLLFELNPSLTSIEALTPGTRITLPRIGQGGTNHRFTIHVDPGIRASITSCRETLSGAVSDEQPAKKSLENETEREQFRSDVLDIRSSMSYLSLAAQDNSILLSETILKQVLSECMYVERVLVNQAQFATEDQVKRISLVKKDLELKRNNLNEQRGPGDLPTRWLDTIVSVNTIAKGATVSNLRVCWAAEALMGVPGETHPLAKISSPAEDVLPEADYMFWAAQDSPTDGQQCTKRVSAPLQVAVRKNGSAKKVIDLTVEAPK